MAYWPDFGVTPGGEEITKPCPFPGAGFFSGTLVTTVQFHKRASAKFAVGLSFVFHTGCYAKYVVLRVRICSTQAPASSGVSNRRHGPEQIALDHEAVEAPDTLLRVDPVQHQVVLDRGAQLVRHSEPEAAASSHEHADRSRSTSRGPRRRARRLFRRWCSFPRSRPSPGNLADPHRPGSKGGQEIHRVVRRSRRAIGLLSFSRLRSAQNLAPPFPHPPRLCRKPLSGVSQVLWDLDLGTKAAGGMPLSLPFLDSCIRGLYAFAPVRSRSHEAHSFDRI